MEFAVELLCDLWRQTAERLERRLEGLTDEEYFWEPVADCWTVKQDSAAAGRWTYDYEFAPTPPAPITTIAWRLVHIAADNWIYWEHAFGPGQRNFPELHVPATAQDAIESWLESRRAVTAWLGNATNVDLIELRPSHHGGRKTAGKVVTILIDEQTHHGAEIALLRDLYLRR